ncbi:DUF84 family protein [Planomicrobium sp. Y74]|uniref:DUF84 family protein n=1 Tax=Planomicrobium sp. Y74 TaxID=2478977 RepID=UPI000EF542A3|nr:DUF84 family protein [Planomicrobium sp. Y74]RLQ91842.1 DUF84 family protein [Planomicrobium sp. Y74]
MDDLKIAVASKNQAKIRAVSECLGELGIQHEITAVETDSGVSAQPFSMEETRQGAVNRAVSAIEGPFDCAVGLEGGVYEIEGKLYLCNWGALAAADGKVYTAGGAQIPLPDEIGQKLKEGLELGPVMDDYANETGIRHDKGAIGILTAGLMNRGDMFGHIVKLLIGQYKLGSG